MLIETIQIKNFRCIRELTLDCDNLTAIIGRNGAGKSTCLYALDVFYDTAANLKLEDFFDKDEENIIEITVTYKQLTTQELEEFKTYIKDGKLIVKKKIASNGGRISQKYYGVALQIPEFAEVRKITSKNEKKDAWHSLREQDLFSGLEKVKSADQIESLMQNFEDLHQELKVPVEKEEQFFGAKAVGGGKLDKYTRFVLVPAVKDVSEEATGKRGAIFQLINMIVLREVNSRPDVMEFKNEFEAKIKQIYSSENLTELPLLGKKITESLQVFAPGSELKLRWDEINAPDIQLPTALATLVEDEFEGEISKKGNGLQRALIITLLQQLAITEEQQIDEQNKLNTHNPNLILAIEEPELYLHPSREKYLSNLLLELSSPRQDKTIKNQIIYATHSPYFIDLYRFDQIRCIRKIQTPETATRCSIVSKYSLDEASKEAARISNEDAGNFSAEGFQVRAIPVMNVIVNEGFFADKVLVVEGLGDVGIFWKLQEILKLNWTQKNISVIPAFCKNNIDRPVIIFRGLSIPTYFVFDGDKSSGNSSIKTNRRYLQLANTNVVDFPVTQVEATWAVFEDKIETELKKSLGEQVFTEIATDIKEKLCYEKIKDVFKNMIGASMFIEEVYSRKLYIELLEEILNKVESL